MFSEYRIPAALLYLLCSVLYVSGEEVIRLQELEGNTVTIHTGITGVQTDAHILWSYISEKVDIKIVDSLVFKGETNTDYNRDRFRDRLQLNRTSGSLTIRNISREDSGVYILQIITGALSVWSFSVDVYAPVSKPIIRNQAGNHRESCSPLCIVENGKDVSLYWYEEKERISSITSSDSSEHLYLPLNITNLISTYTCVAINPVINQTGNHSVIHRESCSPLCTVENGKDVSLYWYEDKEGISNITSSDSSERLYLPLNKTNLNSSTYTCVAANPVSNQTVQLNITELCNKADPVQRDLSTTLAVLIPVGLTVAVLSVLFVCFWKKKKKKPVPEDAEI